MEPSLESNVAVWDDPSSAPDTLNRTEFAGRVARGLSNWSSNESLVTAIYGPWGSGKTWLLKNIEATLIKTGETTICHFSPWQYESNAQITAEFFASVSKVLDCSDTKNDKARQRSILWKKLGQAVAVGQIGLLAASTALGVPVAVPGVLNWLKSLLKIGQDRAEIAAQAPGIAELRNRLLKLFSDPDAKKILVMIDDLDRLEDEQIRMIFRLVKTTANFPNLNYLLLGERSQLAAALDSISNGHGDRYLEKIVQIPLTLPRASSHQIRGRLWDGLEIVAGSCNYELEKHLERYESFWREFLRKSLHNYRSVHRLLTTVSFHSRCLTKDGTLEVDLLDLVGIDFVRGSAPRMYDKLAADPPDSSWLISNRSYSHAKKGYEDSDVALDLISGKELDQASSFHLLVHLFPDFYSLLPETSQQRVYAGNDHQKFKLSASDHPIWDDRFQPLYFQIASDAGFLPTSRYREFISLKNALEMIRRFEDWESKGWRKHLISLLNDDPSFYESNDAPEEFLLALSSVSDDLENDGSILEGELDTAARLWMKMFAKVPENDRIQLLRRFIEESRGISILLLIFEELRNRNSAEFFEGAKAEPAIPHSSKEEIEEITESFFPQIEKRFMLRKFPVGPNQAWRLYRLAHAIGPVRLERILRRELDQNEADAPWAIAKAIIWGLMPKLRLDLSKVESVGPVASKNVMAALLQFASADFWSDFRNQASEKEALSEIDLVVLLHIESGLDALRDSPDLEIDGE
ncbi:MAG: hypothetical protein KBF76_14420 [Verrucomicrobiales bacterium]|jgi:hypothetical protein|nr:hypothetical protein [Verrucomicrobiales bacterium]